MRYVVSVGALGYTRTNNVCVFNPETRGFDDLTPAEARRYIDRKQIRGILWRNGDEGPEFYPDNEGFNQQDLMIKSANKFRPMIKDVPGSPVNSFFTVVRVLETDYRGRLYEIVSNKYSRVKVSEEQLRELNNITVVAGVWINDNEIKVCDGVLYENRLPDALFKKGVYKDGIAVETLPTVKEVLEPEEKAEEPVVEEKSTDEKVEGAEEKQPETLSGIFDGLEKEIAEQAEKVEQKNQPKKRGRGAAKK